MVPALLACGLLDGSASLSTSVSLLSLSLPILWTLASSRRGRGDREGFKGLQTLLSLLFEPFTGSFTLTLDSVLLPVIFTTG